MPEWELKKAASEGPGRSDALRAPLASPAWALILLLAGLVFTVELARRESNASSERIAAAHGQLADTAQVRLRLPLEAASLSLRAMQTVFLSDDQMDQELFSQYQRNLRSQELVSGYVITGFARRGPASTSGQGYTYQFVSPLAGNEAMVGFDIARQPENLHALHQARDADTPIVSAPFRLAQFRDVEGTRALGVTVRLPVYSRGEAPRTLAERREREIGALAISLHLQPMVRSALEGRILDEMHVLLRDLDAAPGRSTVFASELEQLAASAPLVRRIDYGGRRWELRLAPRSQPATSGRAGLILSAGGMISLLLALLLWSQGTVHRRAVELGRRMWERFGESEARFKALNELLPALVLLADGNGGRIVYANQAARRRLGEVSGRALEDVFADPQLAAQALVGSASGEDWSGKEAVIQAADGSRFWANVALARVDMEGAPHLLLVANDTSEQRELTERLRFQAAHDALTELPNRREFERRLQQALDTHAGEPGGRPFGLLYIDLDQFKLINDLSGHMAGDQLLIQLVHVMRQRLRPGDLLARLGGDEFGLLAFDVDQAGIAALAEKIRACIEAVPFSWHGRNYSVSASIGMVLVDRPGCTLKDLLAWADSACYQAKEAGRNRVSRYLEDEDASRRFSEMEWANRVRLALEQERLLLDYQEVIPLDPAARGGTTRLELLLRLREEDGSVVLPGAFLPAAERYGLMPAIDRWVIRTALANHNAIHPSGPQLGTFAINLSGASIEHDGLADYILQCLDTYQVPAHKLYLEITETVAVRNLLKVVQVMERLRAAGCRIALDDFGAGMSSFAYLKNLPVDVIKIDGSFVRDLATDPMSQAIVNAVVQIGHQRGLRVVAEWVADEETAEVLRDLGVDYGQGFALHRPERVVFQRVQPRQGAAAG
jgi:diguanylate cyclase (GGDEF)-like protein/PAS domain S-box-containing protein